MCSKVKQKGKLSHKAMLIAVENWVKKRVSVDGILLLAECDTKYVMGCVMLRSDSATLFVDFMELPCNVIYYSLIGDIRLERDEDDLVRFMSALYNFIQIRFAFGRNLAPNSEVKGATPGRGRGARGVPLQQINSPLAKGLGRGRIDGLHAIKSNPSGRQARAPTPKLNVNNLNENSENSENGIGLGGSSSVRSNTGGLIMRQQVSRRRGAKKGGTTPRNANDKRVRDSEEDPLDAIMEEGCAAKKQKISPVKSKVTATAPSNNQLPMMGAPPPAPGLPPPPLALNIPPPPPPPLLGMKGRILGPPLPPMGVKADPGTPPSKFYRFTQFNYF